MCITNPRKVLHSQTMFSDFDPPARRIYLWLKKRDIFLNEHTERNLFLSSHREFVRIVIVTSAGLAVSRRPFFIYFVVFYF